MFVPYSPAVYAYAPLFALGPKAWRVSRFGNGHILFLLPLFVALLSKTPPIVGVR